MDKKVGVLYSIRTKILAAIIAMSLFTGLIIEVIYNVNVTKMLNDVNKHYVEDIAIAYGTLLELQIEEMGKEHVLTKDVLEKEVGHVGLDGVESSYVYVVAPDGNILFHPDTDKIGKKVENDAVTSIVDKLSKGKDVENEVIVYEYDGANKYAGTFVNETKDFILIVTVDENEIQAPVNAVRNTGVIVLITMAIISVVIAFVLAAIILKPIQRLDKLIEKLANMDIRKDEDYDKLGARKDEIGVMSRAISSLRDAFEKIIKEIRVKSDSLMESAATLNINAKESTTTMGQIESAVDDIAQGASSQAEDTQRATENVLVMGSMIEETNLEVRSLLQYASEMKDSADQAREILEKLNKINTEAGNYIEVIATQTETTNQSAVKISEATKLITSIAEETNLLSLNASIEAARAGEQGRGFAVVAAEIQKLAEQSNESAQKIEQIIHELIADSEKAVETMESVKAIMNKQSEHVGETDEAFTKIDEGVQLSIQGINAISQKAEQLDEARSNVVDLVQNLTAIAEENAASSQETSASVTEITSIIDSISDRTNSLKSLADGLEEDVSVFKV